jgi:integrase
MKPKGQSLPLNAEQVSAIRTLLKSMRRYRDLALFNTGIDTMLRISDLLSIRICDVVDSNGNVRDEIALTQKKTEKPVRCVLGPKSREAIAEYLGTIKCSPKERLFGIDIRQAQRLMKLWMEIIHVDGRRYSPHSLRRTKASIIYRETKNIEAVRQLLGHASVAATSAYLGVEQDEALALARSIEV